MQAMQASKLLEQDIRQPFRQRAYDRLLQLSKQVDISQMESVQGGFPAVGAPPNGEWTLLLHHQLAQSEEASFFPADATAYDEIDDDQPGYGLVFSHLATMRGFAADDGSYELALQYPGGGAADSRDVHIHWTQASSPLREGAVEGFRLIDGPANGVRNFGGLRAAPKGAAALLYGGTGTAETHATKYPVGCKALGATRTLPKVRGAMLSQLALKQSASTPSEMAEVDRAGGYSGSKLKQSAVQLHASMSGGRQGNSPHPEVLLWVRRQPKRETSFMERFGEEHVTPAEKAALLQNILLEQVPVSISSTVEASKTTLEACAELIDGWSRVKGIRDDVEGRAARALYDGAVASSGSGPVATAGGADSEMECEVQKEQEQEQELELTALTQFARVTSDGRRWTWSDLDGQPALDHSEDAPRQHSAFYRLSNVRLQLSGAQMRKLAELEQSQGTRSQLSLSFPSSLELSDNVMLENEGSLRTEDHSMLSTLEKRIPSARAVLEWHNKPHGPHVVAVSLAEAQALRVCLMHGGGGGDVRVTLRALDSGTLLGSNISARLPLHQRCAMLERELQLPRGGRGLRGLLDAACKHLDVPIGGSLDERAHKCYEALYGGIDPSGDRGEGLSEAEFARLQMDAKTRRTDLHGQRLLLRFFNNDSWFTETDLELLGQKLAHMPVTQREYFFYATLALRRRTTSEDASVLELFRDPETGALVRAENLSDRLVNMLGFASPQGSGRQQSARP